MRFASLTSLCSAMLIAAASATMIAHPAAADPINVATTANGASFVTASSAYPGATGQNLSYMQTNPIAANPTPWLSNGETRYIFAGGDAAQTYEIKLGSIYSLMSFSTSFPTGDRTVSGPFTVQTSLDGITFTAVAGTVTGNGTGTDTLTATAAVVAQYVLYGFGPASTQYGTTPGSGGSGITNVTAMGSAFAATAVAATAVPEPASLALLGAGMVGLGALRRRRAK